MKNIIIVLILFLFTSCATMLGGVITPYQRTKPLQGVEPRQVRIVPLIANLIIFPPLIIIDFATGAIYKPKKP